MANAGVKNDNYYLVGHMKNQRMILAYIFSPIIPAVAYYIFSLLWMDKYSSNLINLLVCAFIVFFSYGGCLIFAPLTLMFLRKFNCICIPFVVILGTFWGVFEFYIIGFLIAFFLEVEKDILLELGDFIWGGILGFSVSLLFCLISGIPMNVKKDENNVY